MPITRGAKKAHRQSLRRRAVNLRRKSKASDITKALKKLVATGDKKAAQALMKDAQQAIDKAVKGKVLSKNTAARKKSRLSKLVKKLS